MNDVSDDSMDQTGAFADIERKVQALREAGKFASYGLPGGPTLTPEDERPMIVSAETLEVFDDVIAALKAAGLEQQPERSGGRKFLAGLKEWRLGLSSNRALARRKGFDPDEPFTDKPAINEPSVDKPSGYSLPIEDGCVYRDGEWVSLRTGLPVDTSHWDRE